jgi:hypothetical protein
MGKPVNIIVNIPELFRFENSIINNLNISEDELDERVIEAMLEAMRKVEAGIPLNDPFTDNANMFKRDRNIDRSERLIWGEQGMPPFGVGSASEQNKESANEEKFKSLIKDNTPGKVLDDFISASKVKSKDIFTKEKKLDKPIMQTEIDEIAELSSGRDIIINLIRGDLQTIPGPTTDGLGLTDGKVVRTWQGTKDNITEHYKLTITLDNSLFSFNPPYSYAVSSHNNLRKMSNEQPDWTTSPLSIMVHELAHVIFTLRHSKDYTRARELQKLGHTQEEIAEGEKLYEDLEKQSEVFAQQYESYYYEGKDVPDNEK